MSYTANYANTAIWAGQNTTGALVTLPQSSQNLTITARSEWYVRAQIYQANLPPGSSNPTPAAPGSTPAPGAGTLSAQGWVHMLNGDIYTLPTLQDGSYYSTVEGFCVAAGDLSVNGGF